MLLLILWVRMVYYMQKESVLTLVSYILCASIEQVSQRFKEGGQEFLILNELKCPILLTFRVPLNLHVCFTNDIYKSISYCAALKVGIQKCQGLQKKVRGKGCCWINVLVTWFANVESQNSRTNCIRIECFQYLK